MHSKDIVIRNYRIEDKSFIIRCMNGMQRHIASIDPLKRSRRPPLFSGKKWVVNLLKKINKNGGVILMAEYCGKKAGVAAGILKQSTQEDLLDTYPFKDGRIIELFVDARYRGKHIGSLLIENMERYFREQGCSTVELGCLAANVGAHTLYKKHKYFDRNIDMCKTLVFPNKT